MRTTTATTASTAIAFMASTGPSFHEGFSMPLSPGAHVRGDEGQATPNWQQKHDEICAAEELRTATEEKLLSETLASLREVAAGLEADRWMFER